MGFADLISNAVGTVGVVGKFEQDRVGGGAVFFYMERFHILSPRNVASPRSNPLIRIMVATDRTPATVALRSGQRVMGGRWRPVIRAYPLR